MGALTVEELEIIVSAKIEQVKPQIQKVVQEIKNAVKDTDGIGSQLLGKIDTAKIAKDVSKAKKQVKEIFDPDDTKGMKIDGKRIIAGVSKSIDSLKGKKIDLGNAIDLQNYQNKLSQITASAKEAKKAISNIQGGKYVNYDSNAIQGLISSSQAKDKKISVSTQGTEKVKNELKESTSHGNRLSKAIEKVKSHLSGAGNNTKKISTGLNTARNAANKVSAKLKVGLGQIMRIAGSLIGLHAIYSGLQNVANSWLSSQNTQAQQLSANIEYMKYALGSALAPVIETIVNLIYQALKGVQSLIYALTGVNIFANASAKAYSSMADSAESAQKATNSLADIDEIHNIQENSDSGNSGGNGNPNFDLSGIETADWIQKLIDNVKNGNWYEIGASIGTKLNETLDKIPWNKIKEKAGKCGKNLAEFINGGVHSTDWNKVGGTLAEGVNTVFSFLGNFLETADFRNYGKAVSEAINVFFDKVEWDNVGKTLSDGVSGTLDFMLGAIESFDSDKVYSAIGKMLTNINWSKIVSKLMELLGWAVATFTGLPLGKKILEKIIEAVKSAKNYFKQKIEDCGGSIVDGIFQGILDGLVNIATWIKEKVFQPFITGFKNAFGIHSPSTVMAEQGEYIIEGLKNGIINSKAKLDIALTKLKLWFAEVGENIINTFIGAWNEVIKLINSISIDVMGKHIGFNFDTVQEVDFSSELEKELEEMEKAAEKSSNAINKTVKTGANSVRRNIQGPLTLAETDMSKTFFAMNKTATSELASTNSVVSEKMTFLKDLISGNYKETEKNVQQSTTQIKNTTETNFNNLKNSSVFSKLKQTVQNCLNLASQSKKWGSDTTSNYNSGLNSQQSSLKTVLDSAKSKVQTALNQAKSSNGWGSSTISKYKDGANSQRTQLNSILDSVKEKVRTSLERQNSSYTWGKDMLQGFINGINAVKKTFTNTISSIANTIWSKLHFSRPEEGPLRDYETWMPDMIQGLSRTLLESAPVLDNAVTDVSNQIADNLRATSFDLDVNSNVNRTINSNVMSSQLENAVYSAIQKAENLFRLTINNELKVNSKTIAQEILDDLNNETKRRGYKPLLQRG